jgi:hypothetical protein
VRSGEARRGRGGAGAESGAGAGAGAGVPAARMNAARGERAPHYCRSRGKAPINGREAHSGSAPPAAPSANIGPSTMQANYVSVHGARPPWPGPL